MRDAVVDATDAAVARMEGHAIGSALRAVDAAERSDLEDMLHALEETIWYFRPVPRWWWSLRARVYASARAACGRESGKGGTRCHESS